VLVIILKRGIRPIERTPIIIAGMLLVIIIRIIIIERIVALEHKKGSKNRYYRLY